MNISIQPPAHNNPVHLGKILLISFLITLLLTIGLGFVYLKNRQFGLGEQIRQTEREIRQVRSENEVLLARLAGLSSRPALQKRIADGFIAVVQISSDKIARLTPPAQAVDDGGLRTVFNDSRPQ